MGSLDVKSQNNDEPQLDNHALLKVSSCCVSLDRGVAHWIRACTLMQAASWLGVSNPEELLRTEGTGFAAPRPEGLGLGAKFLPHHKVRGQPQQCSQSLLVGQAESLGLQASHLTAPVEKRLGKRLRQQEDGARQEDAGTSPHKKRLGSHSHQSPPTAGHQCAAAVARSPCCCCRLLLYASSHNMLHMQRHAAAMRSKGELQPSRLHANLASQELLREAYQSATRRNLRRQKPRTEPIQVYTVTRDEWLSPLRMRFQLHVSVYHVGYHTSVRPLVSHTLMKWFYDYFQCQDWRNLARRRQRSAPACSEGRLGNCSQVF